MGVRRQLRPLHGERGSDVIWIKVWVVSRDGLDAMEDIVICLTLAENLTLCVQPADRRCAD
jgi:hypothetical protein